MKLDFTNLEQNKIEAIRTTECPLLIIAAPGSGKTRTLIERVLYLIVEQQVNPEKIFISTFTEKAAAELKTRISNKILELNIKINVNDLYIGTLHGLFLRIIEDYREYSTLNRNYRVLDGFEQNYFVYQNLKKFESIEGLSEYLGNRRVFEKSEALSTIFNKLKEEMVNLSELKLSDNIVLRSLALATEKYNALLIEENCLDFSGIQQELYNMLNKYPKFKETLQDNFSYLMVDEYQDTNTIQEELLLQISEKHQRICVVGDDDQALYRFRGATVQNILSFKSNFPEGLCKSIKLETNYRSHPGIIQFYKDWMEHIPGNWEGDNNIFYRYFKDVKAQNKEFNEYKSVIKVSSDNDEELWHNEILKFIVGLKDGGKITDYNQIAFLFRSVTNLKVRKLANFLEANNIPVFSPRSNQFFQRDEVKLLLGSLLVIFPNWKNITAFNNGYKLEEWKYYQRCMDFLLITVKNDLTKHKSLLQYLVSQGKTYTPLKEKTTKTISSLFYELLQFPLFAEILDIDMNSGVLNKRAAYNISAFSQLIVKFEYLHRIDVFTPKNFEQRIRSFLNSYLRFLILGGLSEYEGFDEYAPSGNVSFMTIHQSKGLEFPIVITGSLGNVPRKQYSELDEELQEKYYKRQVFEPLSETKYFDFWRLYYTAFSRAKNLLVLTADEKTGRGAEPSSYFKPIYTNLPKWNIVDMDLLPLEEVHETNIKKEYSFTSDVLLYENCPLQYKFYRTLEFQSVRHGTALFGSLVHQTIEDIHKTVIRGERDTLSDERIESWFNINYQTLSKNMRTYLNEPQLNDALKQIKSYVNKQQSNWDAIKEAEVDVSLVKDEYILRGKVDLVKGKNNTVEIVDFKTGKKPDVNNDEDKILLQKYRRQIEIYSHLVEQRYGLDVSKMHLYYTTEKDGVPTITYPYNKNKIKHSINGFSEVVKQIEKREYDMTSTIKTKKLCENCDMQFYCNSRV